MAKRHLLVYISFILVMFACVRGCSFNGISARALSAHQKKCQAYHNDVVHSRQIRKTVAERSKQRKLAIQLRRTYVDEVTAPCTPHNPIPDAGTSEPFAPILAVPDSDEQILSPRCLSPSHAGPAEIPGRRPQRQRRLPARYRDRLPEPAPAILPPKAPPTVTQPLLPRIRLIVRDSMHTVTNAFGLCRQYLHRPTFDPDDMVPPGDLAAETWRSETPSPVTVKTDPKNTSVELLLEWQNTGSELKSNTELNRLVNVLRHPNFSVRDLERFDATRENRRWDQQDEKSPALKGFQEKSVKINVPSGDKDIPSTMLDVPGLHYRKLTSLIRSAFESPLASKFHFTPFRLFYQPSGSEAPERVFSELYNSDAFIKEHDRVQRAPVPAEESGCTREKIVAALMFWSDATHLANFGTAKLWPIYMFLGNLSKYIRAEPTSNASHHVAYIPSILDSLQDALASRHAKWHTQKKQILTHCRRELMHAVWTILLDDDFLHAYKYGIVIRCHDGIERRVYPRIFTYSADYPEKVVIATIRDKGICPCPRCLITKDRLDKMGLASDIRFRLKNLRTFLVNKVVRAREWVYKKGRGLNSKAVEDLLKETSSVLTMNAFVDRLGKDFDVHSMLVVDMMHEFELGVWKSLFTHLIRILHAAAPNGSQVAELDERYRQILAFGSTIRGWSNNASEMKKLAARDFEDLLQCSIPVFEGLLEEPYNAQLMKLLYRAAEWHAFAKMRLHTESTLDHLDKITADLGKLMRNFEHSTRSQFATFELTHEAEARQRRDKNHKNKKSSSSKRVKWFNLFTYKWHALADYVPTIRLFGGSDGFSTQIGEQAHRLVKRLYKLTNKRNPEKQIGKRVRRMEMAQQAFHRRQLRKKQLSSSPQLSDAAEKSDAAIGDCDLRFFISPSQNDKIDIYQLLKTHKDDPVYKGFLPKLQDHLLGRLLGKEFDGDSYGSFTPADRQSIHILAGKMYSVQTCQLYYTTYDVQRQTDTINPRTCPDVMVHASPPDDDTDANCEPYWYARVLGIYHVKVSTTHPDVVNGGEVHRMEFLWVRWLGAEPGHKHGFHRAILPKIGFVPSADDYAFGFLDPKHVIRSCHLIPAFSCGRTSELLPVELTKARCIRKYGQPHETDDWTNFYVNIFVDRDMVMRHFGGGIGHLQSPLRQDEECVVSERDSKETSNQRSDTREVVVVGQDTTLDEDSENSVIEDLDDDEDSDPEMETSLSSGSSTEDDDSDDDGYDSL